MSEAGQQKQQLEIQGDAAKLDKPDRAGPGLHQGQNHPGGDGQHYISRFVTAHHGVAEQAGDSDQVNRPDDDLG